MDGERALIYVRTRHSDGDFSRSARQLQVLQALAAKAIQPETWPRLPELYRVLRDGVVTDLTPGDGLALLQLASAVAGGEVKAATLEDATTPWITPGGAWVLLPNGRAIEQIVAAALRPRMMFSDRVRAAPALRRRSPATSATCICRSGQGRTRC